MNKKRKIYIGFMRGAMIVCTALIAALVLFLMGYVLVNGIPNITWELLSTKPSYLTERIGILPDILNTVYIVLATLVIVLPLGVGAAIYLTEYAKNKKLVAMIEYAAETLSGIPSIIYGLVGMLLFSNNFGTSLLAGALTLVIMNLPAIAAIILISAVVALVLSNKMAKDIVKPLNQLDLENPAENETYEELAPILTKLNKQHKQITRQMQELRQKSDEFEQITASMNEGLVLLDKKGVVLSINAAAKKLFSADETAVGRDFLTLDRSIDMSRAIEKALDGRRAEFREERNGREYQFVINRTESDGKTVGIVILCFDVTETAFAERNRKEFTANVSHELKTPLQSIIGSAELLENGLVKPEDTKRFVGNIKNEATRLVSLINDIIRLSQLDEDSEPATESVDLYDVANEVIEVLTISAAKKQV